MKLFNLSLIATVFGKSSNDERKIPPRTPTERITWLNKRLIEWIDVNISGMREGRAENMSDNVKQRITDKIEAAFEIRKCAKWDKTWPNGGPDPEGPLGNVQWKDYRKQLIAKFEARVAAKNASSRKRRDANIRARRDAERLAFIDVDEVDDYFNNPAQDGERSVAIERVLSDDPNRRLDQILVSYMKWAFRYMGDCPNDAAGTHAAKMYEFVETNLLELYELIQTL